MRRKPPSSRRYRAGVPRRLRVGELRIATEGLAIFRAFLSGEDSDIHARLDGIRASLSALDHGTDDDIERLTVNVCELEAVDGYARWATTYDDPGNALIDLEGAVMRRLVGPPPWGDVLDACTGTGRHLRWLAEQAASATGLDQSAEMLARAQSAVPSASFLCADLLRDHDGDLPDASFDLIVCSLALTHFVSLDEPVAAFARLVRPGGRVVITDAHPVMALLDGQAFFFDADGSTPFVRNHVHQISAYLRAFRAAGLAVDDCDEFVLGPGDGPAANGVVALVAPEASRAAFVGMPFVLGWSLRRPAY